MVIFKNERKLKFSHYPIKYPRQNILPGVIYYFKFSTVGEAIL